jgi:hypothetical protein
VKALGMLEQIAKECVLDYIKSGLISKELARSQGAL